jgi:hypothetical protein
MNWSTSKKLNQRWYLSTLWRELKEGRHTSQTISDCRIYEEGRIRSSWPHLSHLCETSMPHYSQYLPDTFYNHGDWNIHFIQSAQQPSKFGLTLFCQLFELGKVERLDQDHTSSIGKEWVLSLCVHVLCHSVSLEAMGVGVSLLCYFKLIG